MIKAVIAIASSINSAKHTNTGLMRITLLECPVNMAGTLHVVKALALPNENLKKTLPPVDSDEYEDDIIRINLHMAVLYFAHRVSYPLIMTWEVL